MKQIETEVWVPNPEKPGYAKRDRFKSYQEVFEELVAELKNHKVFQELESFNNVMREKAGLFEPYHAIACFVKEGANEGHYIHVEMLTDTRREVLYLGKTFGGIDHALELSNLCTKAFYR